MATVQGIVVEKLLEVINRDKKLPWMRPFLQPAINWSYKREYTGINRYILQGGEYITMYALGKLNEEKGTKFLVRKGEKSHIVTYYKREYVPVHSASESLKRYGKLTRDKNGVECYLDFKLLYTRVFEVGQIEDVETGEVLKRRLGTEIKEFYSDVEVAVSEYLTRHNIKLTHTSGGGFYTETKNTINIPPREYFSNLEAYYRVLFHEMIHSTGVKNRLNRSAFIEYHQKKEERSTEELIAETGSLLLATEFGFREDFNVENSLTYIQSWGRWIKDNPFKVVSGFQQAEKAVSFILGSGDKEDLGMKEIS